MSVATRPGGAETLAGLPQGLVRHDPARPLAFMHVPKTAGIAMIGGLAGALRPRRVVSGFDHSLFGAFDGFDTIDPDLRRHIYASPAEVPRDGDFIAGHMAPSTLVASYPDAQLVTCLREPRARLLSHWVYWRAQPADHVSAWGSWARISLTGHDPLAGFLGRRDIACQTDNLALRLLLWPHKLLPPDDFIAERDDDALLEAALMRLRGFAYADVVENPRLVANASAWCGRPVTFPVANATPAVPAEFRVPLRRELTALAYDRLCARSRLDLWLWTAVAERQAPGVDVARLCEYAVAQAVARCSDLLGGGA